MRNAWDIAVRELERRAAAAARRLRRLHDPAPVRPAPRRHAGPRGGDRRAGRGREFDLCVLTGDYRTELHGPIRPDDGPAAAARRGRAQPRTASSASSATTTTATWSAPMEAMGIRMLVNESVAARPRRRTSCRSIGTDDVHYYFTDQAVHALEAARDAFTVALVHSPEVYDVAAELGVDLYLCGHTHAGQVCLPGGRPVITHLSRGRRFYRGTWRHRGMVGVTNAGVGTSGRPGAVQHPRRDAGADAPARHARGAPHSRSAGAEPRTPRGDVFAPRRARATRASGEPDPHGVARRAALAGGAAELPRPPDARGDEVLRDGRHPEHRHRGELGLHARPVQVGLCLPQPGRRLHRRPLQPALHHLRQPVRLVGGDLGDRPRHDLRRPAAGRARSWASARRSTSRRRWR